MILKSLILLLTITSSLSAQTDLRAGIGLITNVNDDPYCDESFIAGYESAGGKWSGFLNIEDSLSKLFINDTSFSSRYDLFTWNSGAGSVNIIGTALNSSRGMQYFLPSGSNNFRYNSYTSDYLDPIICGSGRDSNITGYGCEFWDTDPFGYNDTILNVIQGGKKFFIAKLIRVNDTILGIRFKGDSLNVNGFEHGIPIRISGLSGTDILPLPEGLYYPSYGTGNYLLFNINTASGTKGKEQTPFAGILKIGTSDNNVYIRTLKWNLFYRGTAYSVFGITGFENNMNGSFAIDKWINQDFFGDKAEIKFNLISGSYRGGGRLSFNSQSYGTPYIAGKIAFIKDSVSHRYNRICSWWEARFRARMTATGNGTFDIYSGYGRINVINAINYNESVPEDPFKTLSIGNIRIANENNIIVLHFDKVKNATSYRIYKNDVLLKTIEASSNVDYVILKVDISESTYPNNYSYSAFRDTVESEISNNVTDIKLSP